MKRREFIAKAAAAVCVVPLLESRQATPNHIDPLAFVEEGEGVFYVSDGGHIVMKQTARFCTAGENVFSKLHIDFLEKPIQAGSVRLIDYRSQKKNNNP